MITLHANNLSKSYGRDPVFQNLSFRTSSRVVGIAGQNGAGKSTLLLCLARLLKPTSGSVTWLQDGNEIQPEKLMGGIGFAAPYVELYEELSCEENLNFLIRLKRSDDEKYDLNRLLQQFEAEKLSDKPWGELSTGQKQRVKLVASCLHNPMILCLDEPGSNLDARGKQLIVDTVTRYKEAGKMILIASNQQEELALCEEVIQLDASGQNPATDS